jgi:hypothetical protein
MNAELADLNTFYDVTVSAENAVALVDELNASDLVETAYFAPLPAPLPATDIAPSATATFGSWVGNQGYLNASPLGIDAKFSWSRPGGTGSQVRVVDIEYGWNTGHEDLGAGSTNLPAVALRGNCPGTAFSLNDHGTAVLGIIVGSNNSNAAGVRYGVTGISYNSSYGIVGDFASSACSVGNTADAINTAAASPTTVAGDIVLIEEQTYGPVTGCPQPPAAPPPCGWTVPSCTAGTCVCANAQYGFVRVPSASVRDRVCGAGVAFGA